jgi:hypothetical protein
VCVYSMLVCAVKASLKLAIYFRARSNLVEEGLGVGIVSAVALESRQLQNLPYRREFHHAESSE